MKTIFNTIGNIIGLVVIVGLGIILVLAWKPTNLQGKQVSTFQSPVMFATVTPYLTNNAKSNVVSGIFESPIKSSTPSLLNIEVTKVEKLNMTNYLSNVWSPSPDGRRILLSKNFTGHQLQHSPRKDAQKIEGRWSGTFDLWLVDAKTHAEQLITKAATYWSWSPDGKSIAYIAPLSEQGMEAELYVVDISTRSLNQVAKADIVLGFEQSVHWLPSNEIVYIFDGHIWSIRPDGSNRHQLNDLHLFQDDAREYEELTAYTGNVRKFYISPNGKQIAYTIIRSYWHHEAWVADINGENPIFLADHADVRSWSPDSQKLTCSVKKIPSDIQSIARNLMVVDFATHHSYLVYEALNDVNQAGYPIWSPDSKLLAFTDAQENILRITNIQGTSQKIFSSLTTKWKMLPSSTQLYPKQWSSDGSYLVMGGGITSRKSDFYIFNLGELDQ